MKSRARANGGALALGRADLGVQGDHDLVERETRTRIVQRVLDLGCEPSVVSCGLMAGSHQFGLAGVAGVHVVHDGGQVLATVPSHSRWKHHAHLTDPAQRPCPAGARFSKNVGSDRQSSKTATELVALPFDASAREAARPTTAVALTSLARESRGRNRHFASPRRNGPKQADRKQAQRATLMFMSICRLGAATRTPRRSTACERTRLYGYVAPPVAAISSHIVGVCQESALVVSVCRSHLDAGDAGDQAPVLQRYGSSSASAEAGCVGSRCSTSFRYA